MSRCLLQHFSLGTETNPVLETLCFLVRLSKRPAAGTAARPQVARPRKRSEFWSGHEVVFSKAFRPGLSPTQLPIYRVPQASRSRLDTDYRPHLVPKLGMSCACPRSHVVVLACTGLALLYFILGAG